MNNFKDGRRQDGVNIFLGNYLVDPLAPSPFKEANDLGSLVRKKKIQFFFFATQTFEFLSFLFLANPAQIRIALWNCNDLYKYLLFIFCRFE